MMKEHFAKNREEMFPWIVDWSDPQNKMRHDNDIKNMSWNNWFWFHPSAFTLLTYGSRVITILVYLFFGIYAFVRGYYFVVFLLGLACLLTARDLKKQIDNWELNKITNFYDIWLRDYDY